MDQIVTTAQHFIVLYYGFIAKNATKKIDKFYHEDAKIWGPVPQNEDIGYRRFPIIPTNSHFNVTDYSIVPVEFNQTINVTVTGNFSTEESIQCFTQCFTLKNIEGKTWIVSDALTFTPADNVIVPEKELIECPPYTRSYHQNKKPRPQKRNRN